ncbi:hypothetical protein GF420_07555 [candidate division GN15 bacterium]|nr:hypothetical protein [candidate division GN15 bacterium]
MRLRLSLTLVTLLLIAASVHSEATLHKRSIEVVTDDSLRLHAELTTVDTTEAAPLLVMLPMRGYNGQSYDTFITAALRYLTADTSVSDMPAPHMLAVDLRGHGESTQRTGESVHYGTMTAAEYTKMPSDVARLLRRVIADTTIRIDTSRIMIVGASIGANTAIMATQHLPGVRRAVMLSPGKEYHSLAPAEAFKDFEGEAMLVTSRGDGYSFESSNELAATKESGWMLKAYPGREHGTSLLYSDKRVMFDVLEWLFRPFSSDEAKKR